jgi:integrase
VDTGTDNGVEAMALTIKEITARQPANWLSDGGSRGNGQLYVRITESDARKFYFRYTTSAGNRDNYPLGDFAEKHTPGKLTLPEARKKADDLRARLLADPERDLRAQDRRDAEARAMAAMAAERAADEQRRASEAAQSYTVYKLADAYADYLTNRGKVSGGEVRGIFVKHLRDSDIASVPANLLTAKQATALFRKIKEAGHGRTAAKLRSYLRAAYALAAQADLDATVPVRLTEFGIESNPIAATASMSGESTPREDRLDRVELLEYFARLNRMPAGVIRDALLIGLLLGAQRPEQLLRLKVSDVDLPAQVLRLYDGKGRRKQPREHELPLTDQAMSILKPLVERARSAQCERVFTRDGKTPIKGPALSEAASAVLRAMHTENKARTPITPSGIRRTAETLFAAMNVPKETRSHIQSHGLAGVQSRHYDRHDYSDEKRATLKEWAALLAGKRKGNVFSFRRKAVNG